MKYFTFVALVLSCCGPAATDSEPAPAFQPQAQAPTDTPTPGPMTFRKSCRVEGFCLEMSLSAGAKSEESCTGTLSTEHCPDAPVTGECTAQTEKAGIKVLFEGRFYWPKFSTESAKAECAKDPTATFTAGEEPPHCQSAPDAPKTSACTGTAVACTTHNAQDACSYAAGCTWDGTCVGTDSSCSSYFTPAFCGEHAGCYYQTACGGTPEPCAYAGSASACSTRIGCTWATPPPCASQADEAACATQTGCLWQ